MEDYKRMVSYLYRYNRGKREDNVGYVKIDVRQGQLKIYISMNDSEAKHGVPHEIYFYYHKEKKIEGIAVGTMEFQNRAAEFRDSVSAENLYNSNMSLDDMGGMIVYFDSEMAYGTEWDDIPIKMEQFQIGEKEDSVVQPIEEPTEGPMEEPLTMPMETEAVLPEAAQKKQEEPVEEESPMEEESIQAPKMESQEAILKEVEVPMSALEKLLKENKNLGHIGNNQILRCVRIEPQDIGKLDISNWRFGNNSFLIHGYYNYHYIMLGAIISDAGDQKFVIGVPGIYGNQEKYLANQFGFRDFLPTKPSDFKTGTFGYWTADIL